MPASDYVIMEMFSREYGWTPEQIRGLRHSDILAYSRIIKLRRAIEHAHRIKNHG